MTEWSFCSKCGYPVLPGRKDCYEIDGKLACEECVTGKKRKSIWDGD